MQSERFHRKTREIKIVIPELNDKIMLLLRKVHYGLFTFLHICIILIFVPIQITHHNRQHVVDVELEVAVLVPHHLLHVADEVGPGRRQQWWTLGPCGGYLIDSCDGMEDDSSCCPVAAMSAM